MSLRCVDSVNSFGFFFSSRRRHTRYWRNWSSDVCSSDLGDVTDEVSVGQALDVAQERGPLRVVVSCAGIGPPARVLSKDGRSEERRVGKECRSRWSPYHSKKKT